MLNPTCSLLVTGPAKADEEICFLAPTNSMSLTIKVTVLNSKPRNNGRTFTSVGATGRVLVKSRNEQGLLTHRRWLPTRGAKGHSCTEKGLPFDALSSQVSTPPDALSFQVSTPPTQILLQSLLLEWLKRER